MGLRTLPARLATVDTRKVKTLKTSGAPDDWRAGKTSSAQRGYGYKWQQARARFLVEHPFCVMCRAEGKKRLAQVVDHRVPHRGDEALFWNEANWQSLCASHHSGAKQREERAAERAGGG